MNIGDAVCVLTKRYEDLPYNATGKICKINPNWLRPYGVRVNEYSNNKSASGLYYFDTDELFELDTPSVYPSTLFSRVIDDAKTYINARFGIKENKIMEQLIKGYRTIIVKIGDTFQAAFACYDDSITEGDAVLCVNDNVEVYGTVIKIFTENDESPEVKKLREVICKLDYTAYNERLERRKKISKLKAAMAKKKEELNELAVYQALAATSPEMADLLKELKELL